MSDAHVFDDLPGFALGILEAEDSARVAAHVAVCDLCKKELAAFEATSAQIATASVVESMAVPDPTLKDKVMRSVQQYSDQHLAARQAGRQTSIPPRADSPLFGLLEAIQNIFRSPAGVVLGLVTALALVMLGISNYRLSQQVREYETADSARYMQVVRLKGTDAAPEANGYVMVFKEQLHGSLAVTHAPLLGADEQYQIWLVEGGVRISGGVFDVNADGYGNLMVSADMPLGEFDSFGITVEPRGGSLQPTGVKVMGN